MTKETLKLALEALEEAWYHVGTFQPTEKAIDLYNEARTVIKEALAQPEQEPVALVISGALVKSELPENYTGHLYTTHQSPRHRTSAHGAASAHPT